jgi:hypothetical protein
MSKSLRFLLLFALILMQACSKQNPGKPSPKAVNGELDVSRWDFEKDGQLKMEGEWLFFPDIWLQPSQAIGGDLQNVRTNLKVPGQWSGHALSNDAPSIPNDSYGTYLLKLNGMPTNRQDLALQLRVDSAFEAYIFTAESADSTMPLLAIGRLGKNRSEEIPQSSRKLGRYTLDSKSSSQVHYLMVHVSNFHYRSGSLWKAPLLESYEKAVAHHIFGLWEEALILGMILIMAIYNVTLFLHRREDISALWLGAFCFCMIARVLSVSQTIEAFYPQPNFDFYQWMRRLEYTTGVLGCAIFCEVLRANFRRFISRKIIGTGWALAIVYTLMVVATDVRWFSETILFMQLYILVYVFYIFSSMLWAAWCRQSGALISVGGFLFIMIVAINDIMIGMGLITMPFLMQYGVAGLIFAQQQLLARLFAEAFQKAEHLSRELKTEVEKQTRDIKAILANIKQGIFSISSTDKPIDPQYSQHLETIVGIKNIEQINFRSLFLDRVMLNSDEKSQLASCLDASIHEESLGFELNQGNLPQVVQYQMPQGSSKILEVDWAPMLDSNDKVEHVLINLRDVTLVKQLQDKSMQQEEDIRILIELINIPEDRFHRFIKKAADYLNQNRELVMASRSPKPEILKQLFMNMHTIKGTARTYLLRAIANASHEAEDRYALIQQGKFTWEEEALISDIVRLESLINHYREVGQEKLGWQLSERIVKLPAKTLESILNSLTNIGKDYLNPRQISQLNTVRSLLFNYGFVRLQDVIEEACRGLDSIARDLGKSSPRIDIDSPVIVMKEEGVNILHSILVHLLRNSLDHGLETPESRKMKRKEEQGTVFLTARLSETVLSLSFHDDGAGLNIEAIRRRGIEKGILREDMSYSTLEVGNLIFESGLSTKEGVSEISGRGVGLGAVRQHLIDIGGVIRLKLADAENASHVNFHFEIEMPSKYCMVFYEFESGDLAAS